MKGIYGACEYFTQQVQDERANSYGIKDDTSEEHGLRDHVFSHYLWHW